MRNFSITFSFAVFSVLVVTQSQYYPTGLEFVQQHEDIAPITEGDVKDSDVTLYLSTRDNYYFPVLLTSGNIKNVDLKKQTKFIIHGWVQNHKSHWLTDMKNEWLEHDDVNVIYVDWERVAKSYFISSAKNSKLVGEILGRSIIKYKFPSKNVHLIGFGIGAHIAGVAAKVFKNSSKNNKIKRITALDPAAPYFRLTEITGSEKLNKDDVEIMDVIHTDSKYMGLEEPIGTIDIYVNGGKRKQPGCKDAELSSEIHEVIQNMFCSHERSHEYFSESINNADIICRKCHSYEDIQNNNCSTTDVYKIIQQNISKDIVGICNAITSPSRPYFI